MAETRNTWDPWAALEQAGDRIELAELDLGGRKALWQRDRLGDLIVLDPDLGTEERRAALAHELIHSERGIGWGAATAATMQREEALVRGEVARRLVPHRDLEEFIDLGLQAGPVDVQAIAEQFGVPVEVAQLAADQLLGCRRPSQDRPRCPS